MGWRWNIEYIMDNMLINGGSVNDNNHQETFTILASNKRR